MYTNSKPLYIHKCGQQNQIYLFPRSFERHSEMWTRDLNFKIIIIQILNMIILLQGLEFQYFDQKTVQQPSIISRRA
jgi:hypothetical protein